MVGFIPENKLSEIKNAADILDIISEAVILKKAGKNYVGLCPFHSEKTPSFTVSPAKQIFYCFGCGTGGNVFSFLTKHEGLTFPEAAKRLAARYGIEIPEYLSPAKQQQISERERLFQINLQAMDFYHQILRNSVGGEKARTYLAKRGVSLQTIANYKLGYAPDGWDNLLDFFSKKEVSAALLEKSGLVLPRKNRTGHYDRFRNRIIFPIVDVNSQVVGFGGRVLDDSLPKYLNSPETPVYNKSRSLYGIHRARERCRITGTVFIVEGYLDLLALHQHGIENSVATLGTALTAEHVRILKRYATRMVLVYDSDEAGIRSAQRCIETFWKEHVDFRREDVFSEENADTHVMVLPAGHDPDSYLFEYGPESFLKAASTAPGIITFLMDCAANKHGLTTEGKIRIIADLQDALAAVNDPVAQALYIKQLAERIDIAEGAILERIRARSLQKAKEGSSGASFVSFTSAADLSESRSSDSAIKSAEAGSRIERHIIAMMLQFPDVLPDILDRKVLDYFQSKTLKLLGESILKLSAVSAGEVSELISRMDSKPYQAIIAELAVVGESWNLDGCRKLLAQFVENSKKQLNSRMLEQQIKAAEKNNDQVMLLKLLHEKQKMAVRSERQKITAWSAK